MAALSLTDPPHLLRQGARAAGCMQALSSACSNAMVSERPPCCRRLWGLDSKVKAKVQLGDVGISGGTAAAFTLSVLPIDEAKYSSSFLFIRQATNAITASLQ